MSYITQEMLTVLGKVTLFIGCIAFIVSIVTEGLKSFKAINKIPSKIVVLCTSIVLTPSSFFAAMSYLNQPIEWFMVFASFLAAFVVAKVAMSGWDDILVQIKRCIKTEG